MKKLVLVATALGLSFGLTAGLPSGWTDDFAAAKDFELVIIDSPKDKSKLSATARTQNPKLVAQYNVRGYPHYVVTDADGGEIARGAGYVKGGPKAFLSKLEQMAQGAGTPKLRGFADEPFENDAIGD